MGGMETTENMKQRVNSSLISKRSYKRERQQTEAPLFKRSKTLASPLCNTTTATTTTSHVEVDPLDLRWRILKELLPQGSKLQAEKGDLLKLVFEHVQDLETKIKAFKHEGGIITNGASKEEMGALQRKGLCIVPLSKLTTAF